jgi:hypothetical protein
MSKETLFGGLFAVSADRQVAAVNATAGISQAWK